MSASIGARVVGGGTIAATITAATFAFAVTAMVTSILHGGPQGSFQPSRTAIADIPADYLQLYLQAGQSRGIDWAILAGIGSIETDHGRSTAAGVRSGVNSYGCCAGPMQFKITGAKGGTWGAYGVDGNHDRRISVYDPADAIPAAADYLKASGAPQDYHRAIFSYNHADWYVAETLEKATEYRGALAASGGAPTAQLTANIAGAAQVLRLADTPRPRIKLTASQRNDLSTGHIDPRVTSILVAIARQHTITVTALKSDHSYLTAGGNVSNHSAGRAVDISVVDGVSCDSIHQGRSGPCWQLARQAAAIKGPLAITELIYGIDPDGPSAPALAQADHTDHLHIGYDGSPNVGVDDRRITAHRSNRDAPLR